MRSATYRLKGLDGARGGGGVPRWGSGEGGFY